MFSHRTEANRTTPPRRILRLSCRHRQGTLYVDQSLHFASVPRSVPCLTHTTVRSTVSARRVTHEGFFAFASAFFTAVRATLVAGLPSKLTLQPARVLLLVIAPANASAEESLIALLLSVSALRSLIGSSIAPSPGLRAVKSADAPASLMSLLSRERILRSRSAPAEICHSDAGFTDEDQAVGREASGAQGPLGQGRPKGERGPRAYRGGKRTGTSVTNMVAGEV